jgi:effector-binding domain-containing protein
MRTIASCSRRRSPAFLDSHLAAARTVPAVDLLPIGRFARLAGLTVRAVRHYGDLGLLEPAWVDADSGYRYYAPAQLARAEAIKRLRSLELGLDEIREVLASEDAVLVCERLVRHRTRMRRAAETTRRILADLDRLIDGREPLVPEPDDVLYELNVKEFPEQTVLSIRERAPLEELKRVISGHYDELFAYLAELGEDSAGPPVTICPFADDEGIVALEDTVSTARALPGHGRIESRILPACTGVSLVHRGPYEELSRSYRAVGHWFERQGLETVGDPREIYWTDPKEVEDPAEWVTEVVWPIAPNQAERARGSGEKFTEPLPAQS